MVAWSIVRPRPEGRPPSVLTPSPEPAGLVEREITIDARSGDRWVRLDLSTGGEVGATDDAGWDLGVRRYQVIVNGGEGFTGNGGVIALDDVAFDSVGEAPSRGYVASDVSRGGDSLNAVLDGWYDYSFTSHLLRPADRVYVVRTADGHYAKLEFLDYYCPGARPGCVTLRYAYQGDGSRRLAAPSPEPG